MFWKCRNVVPCFIIFYRRFSLSNNNNSNSNNNSNNNNYIMTTPLKGLFSVMLKSPSLPVKNFNW